MGKSGRAIFGQQTFGPQTSYSHTQSYYPPPPPACGGTFGHGLAPSQQRCVGKLVLVDCAGSERKEDSAYHAAERRKEGAEINASIYALKECMRAMTSGASHVPFRNNLLTRALKDNFTTPGAQIAVIATVSPTATDTEHSIGLLLPLTRGEWLEAALGSGGKTFHSHPHFSNETFSPMKNFLPKFSRAKFGKDFSLEKHEKIFIPKICH